MNNILILSGRYPSSNFESNINHKVYAEKYGYSYINCNWPTKAKNPYLNKIYYILEYIDKYDYLIWVDDDAFYLDFDKDIMDFAPSENYFLSICESPRFKSLKTYFNTGHFIVKVNDLSIQFFNDVLKENLKSVKKWWSKELGYFSNGDQDLMIYLLKTKKEYIGKEKLFKYETFNSRFENIEHSEVHKPLLLHFTGKPDVKRKNHKVIQEKFNLHLSLVPSVYLKKYSLYSIPEVSILKRIKRFVKKKIS